MTDPSYARAIDEHYTKNWSAPSKTVSWGRGPVAELPVDFRVHVIARAADTMAFATRCMSQPEDEERVELHILCRANDANQAELVEILTAVAHFHRTGSQLGLAHSVNFGKPWIQGSLCTHGLLSLPYLDGPDVEWLEEPHVRFLWLIPITPAEVQFKMANGTSKLEEQLEAAQFDYVDPFRRSVV